MVENDFRFSQSGTLLSRLRRQMAARGYRDDVEREVAQYAKRQVDRRLAWVLRNPTGYYQSLIRAERVGTRWEVNDGKRVPYGPWLEGTGSRNAPVTRFPGYGTFRRTRVIVDRQVPAIADRVWATHGRRRFE